MESQLKRKTGEGPVEDQRVKLSDERRVGSPPPLPQSSRPPTSWVCPSSPTSGDEKKKKNRLRRRKNYLCFYLACFCRYRESGLDFDSALYGDRIDRRDS